MRDILNKPLLELFKKDSTVDVEVQHDAIASLPPNFLNRPISELFQKASDVRSVDPDKHDVTSSENDSSEHSATAHRNIFLRPISELFKHTDEDIQEDDDQVSVLDQLEAIISRLDAEYETLLIAFTNVQHFIAKQNIAAIVEHLSEFRTQFKAYLVLESSLLHHLLKDTDAHSEPEAKIWSDYRVEMHRFTNTILRFLRKWTEHKQVSQTTIQRFEEDYVNTYDVLADRMQHEHSIFNVLPLLSNLAS